MNERKVFEKLKELSFLSLGLSSPNPPVASVITDESGKIIREGYTQIAGGNHAEAECYKNFEKKNHTIYVTLSPCTHFGRTPPCSEIISFYKPKKLIYGFDDPNPIAGSPFEDFKKQGIHSKKSKKIQEISFSYLNGFFTRFKKKRPLLIIKTVVNQDGFFTTNDNEPIRISNKETNDMVQLLRAKCDGVIVGPNTIKNDLPGLSFNQTHKRSGSIVYSKKQNTIHDLFIFGNNKKIIDHHNFYNSNYQPYRIFIFGNDSVSDEFFDKQKFINKRYRNKKCIIYLLNQKTNKGYSKKFLQELKTLSKFPPLFVSGDDIGETILYDLAKKGLNMVMAEGGSLVYQLFQKLLTQDDLILKITGSKKIHNGKKPKISFIKRNLIFTGKLGRDLWEVFTG